MGILTAVTLFLRAMLTAKIHLAAENLALRQQLAVCNQFVKRPQLRPVAPKNSVRLILQGVTPFGKAEACGKAIKAKTT